MIAKKVTPPPPLFSIRLHINQNMTGRQKVVRWLVFFTANHKAVALRPTPHGTDCHLELQTCNFDPCLQPAYGEQMLVLNTTVYSVVAEGVFVHTYERFTRLTVIKQGHHTLLPALCVKVNEWKRPLLQQTETSRSMQQTNMHRTWQQLMHIGGCSKPIRITGCSKLTHIGGSSKLMHIRGSNKLTHIRGCCKLTLIGVCSKPTHIRGCCKLAHTCGCSKPYTHQSWQQSEAHQR